MVGFKIEPFGGLIPRLNKRYLPPNGAQVAQNLALQSGLLRPLREAAFVSTTAKSGTMRSMYRIEKDAIHYWLHWPTDVDVCPSPIAGDETGRIYYTGDGEPRCTNTDLAITGGGSAYPIGYYTLGIHEPQTAPTLAPSGGSSPAVTRAYLYTFVTQWGEESAPSPAQTVTVNTGGTVTISGIDTAPANNGDISAAVYGSGFVTVTTLAKHWLKAGHTINITGVVGMTDLNGDQTVYDVLSPTQFRIQLTTAQTYTSGGAITRQANYNTAGLKIRIYRTVTTVSQGTLYYKVADITAADLPYADSAADTDLTQTMPDSVARAAMPPGGMAGVIALPNGVLAGFVGNEVCLSEPYQPHSWPLMFRQTVDFAVVGLGALPDGLIAATSGSPFVMIGESPEAVSQYRLKGHYPCLSKRSVVSVPEGVIYQTLNGLALAHRGGVQVLTEALFDQRAWETLNPGALMSFFYQGAYLGFWAIDAEQGAALYLELSPERRVSTAQILVTGVWLDDKSGLAYVLQDNEIRKWDAADIRQVYEWRSKEFLLPRPVCLTAAQVDTVFTQTQAERDAIAAENAAITAANQGLIDNLTLAGAVGEAPVATYEVAGDALTEPMSEAEFCQLVLYVDGDAIYSKTVNSRAVFRLPSGYKSDRIEIGISGNAEVQAVRVAETPNELSQL